MKQFQLTCKLYIALILFGLSFSLYAETGYNLWLRYVAISDTVLRNQYRTQTTQIIVQGSSSSSTLAAVSDELKLSLDSLLVKNTTVETSVTSDGAIVAGTPSSSSIISGLGLALDANKDAYRIVSTTVNGKNAIVIASSGETGVLYGAFNLLRLIQTNKPIDNIDISEKPKIRLRLLNHWANLDGSMERGYAGNSIWQWSQLPGTVSSRYKVYARANASIGINGTVLNNVNNTSNTQIISNSYLSKIKALAAVFRPYGIKVYLSAYFDWPISIGGLSTADPLNTSVISWWTTKVSQIYDSIPDFGGFLVKASSEGQAGPKAYGRTHAQGANCIANALASHGGVCIWRTFVYDDAIDTDRMKRAYKEFMPLDSAKAFKSNVILQTKNGPFDFQPREPVHPLFGGLNNTHIGMEFQITQEYLGQGIQLVYLGPYWKEVLDFDTYKNGSGSTVAKMIDGTVNNDTMTCIAGVSNIGDSTNWCGHQFHQANWFAFGRLAWNHDLSSDSIADDWARMTWGNSAAVVSTITSMMSGSREACVNYMMPLGIVGIFYNGTHYGPEPDYNSDASHPDWNSVYWHKADSIGLGYDRTTSGSNFVSQYYSTERDKYNSLATTPPEYLATFHHVKWSYVIPSTGRTFWNELCYRYCIGCKYVSNLRTQWSTLNGLVDATRYAHVAAKLSTHETDANTWRTTCLNYFKTFSKMSILDCSTVGTISDSHDDGIVKQQKFFISDKPIIVYNVMGRCVGMFTGKYSIASVNHWLAVEKKCRNGIYILRQGNYMVRINGHK
jgi:alpha-glucuronidase